MKDKIIVTKGNERVTLKTERLSNNNILLEKFTNGKEFSITLRSFTENEINSLRKATNAYYSNKHSNHISLKSIKDLFKY